MTAAQPTTTLTQDIIWYTNSPILFLCAYGLYRRKQHVAFLAFFVYLIFTGISSYAMLPITRIWGFNSSPSFYVGLGKDTISIGLSFVVFYEVIQNVFTSGTLKITRSTFTLLAAVFLLAGALLSVLMKIDSPSKIMKDVLVAQNVVRFDQVSFLLLLAVLTIFFGLFWGDLAFGIAAGFGVYAIMELLRVYLSVHMGFAGSHFTNLLGQWSYQVASLIWLYYAWKKPKSPSKTLPSDKVSEYTEPIDRLIQ